jgi:hypothetical protein
MRCKAGSTRERPVRASGLKQRTRCSVPANTPRELRVFDLAMANNMAGAKTLSSAQVVPYAPD